MSLDLLIVWIGAAATLGIFSFLWKENPVYRFFEHLFMGLSLGWGIVLSWTDYLEPRWFSPMVGADVAEGASYNPLNLFWILALFAGTMWYFIFTRRFKWIARIVIGLFIGVSAGRGVMGFFRLYLPQITASFKSLWPARESTMASLEGARDNVVFLVTFYSSMAYFLFTFRRENPVLKNVAVVGRWLMMIAFGAMFGSTVMARLSLFIERMVFLLGDWLGLLG